MRYRGTHRTQYDGSKYQYVNCTPTSLANVTRCATGGAIDKSGADIRALVATQEETNPSTPGWSLEDAKKAASRLVPPQPFTIATKQTWAQVLAILDAGYAIVLQGDSDRFADTTCSGKFDGDHAVAVHPDKDGSNRLLGDPICKAWRWESETVLRAYTEKLWGAGNIKFGYVPKVVPELEEVVSTITISLLPYGGGTYTIPANVSVTGLKVDGNGQVIERKVWAARPTQSSAAYDAMVDLSDLGIRGNPFIRATNGFFAGFYLSSASLVLQPNTAPASDCSDCEDALALEKQKTIQLAAAVKEQVDRVATIKSKTAAFNADIADE